MALTQGAAGQIGGAILDLGSNISDLMSQAGALRASAALDYGTAEEAIAAGEIGARRLERSGERYIGSIRASFAKAGVTSEGSPAMAAVATEAAIREDILMTRLNAAKQASDLGFQALQKRIKAGQARTRMWQEAGNTVLKIGGALYGGGAMDMGGGGVSQHGNVYGSNTPSGTRDMGTYSTISY